MSFDIFPSHEIFTGFELDFKGTRVLGDELIPVIFKLRLELAPIDESAEPSSMVNTFTKISYFVDNVLNNSVFIDRMDNWATTLFVDPESGLPICSNNLVMLPASANNITIVKALHCKLNTLACDTLHVGFVCLTSNDAPGLNITSIGEAEETLPTIEDWVGNGHSYFSNPWWLRDDASTMDVAPGEDANLAEPPEFAYSLAFLLDEPEGDENITPKVVRLEFKPRVIQGGKKD